MYRRTPSSTTSSQSSPPKEKATALYNFVPQDPATQIPLVKGDVMEVIRKDSDGWWFVRKGTDKGLVPGSYVRINKSSRAVPTSSMLAAREASNQRFNEITQQRNGSESSTSSATVDYSSTVATESTGAAADEAPPPQAPSSSSSTSSTSSLLQRRVDARAHDPPVKPTKVRKLRKCFACNETILGRTKVAKEQIFHEICLICRGCRDAIEEDEEFSIIKKKAYHTDCAKEVVHCRRCDKEILGRVYRTAGGAFHRLCMTCSSCSQEVGEGSGKIEKDKLICDACASGANPNLIEKPVAVPSKPSVSNISPAKSMPPVSSVPPQMAPPSVSAAPPSQSDPPASSVDAPFTTVPVEPEKRSRVAQENLQPTAQPPQPPPPPPPTAPAPPTQETINTQRDHQPAVQATDKTHATISTQESPPEAVDTTQQQETDDYFSNPDAFARNRKNSVLENMHGDGKRELPPPAPVEVATDAPAASDSANSAQNSKRKTSLPGLDQFDLNAAATANPVVPETQERLSDMTNLESEHDEEEEHDFGDDLPRESLRLSQVFDLEAIESFQANPRSTLGGHDRLSTMSDLSGISEDLDDLPGSQRVAAVQEGNEHEGEQSDEERELCGGCGLVLEGEAVGALDKFFHYECFKCSHCQRMIGENDGYAEREGMAFHQQCYQARYGKKCCRCSQILKGKVVKALEMLYHPDCFVCFACSASLSESFFEHDGQAVCAKCKHNAIMSDAAAAHADLMPIGTATAGYQFLAQDETQLSMNPGDQMAILQKDDDGWWLVELHGHRGYVPGSYLIEHPKEIAKPKEPPKTTIHEPSSPAKPPPAGLCAGCGTQNPDIARFCRSCGNRLQ